MVIIIISFFPLLQGHVLIGGLLSYLRIQVIQKKKKNPKNENKNKTMSLETLWSRVICHLLKSQNS